MCLSKRFHSANSRRNCEFPLRIFNSWLQHQRLKFARSPGSTAKTQSSEERMKRQTENKDGARDTHPRTRGDGYLSAELVEMPAWVPEALGPGHLMLLRNRHQLRAESRPHGFWAVLSCPECGTFGLITERQYAGEHSVLCGNEVCGSHFLIEDRSRFEGV